MRRKITPRENVEMAVELNKAHGRFVLPILFSMLAVFGIAISFLLQNHIGDPLGFSSTVFILSLCTLITAGFFGSDAVINLQDIERCDTGDYQAPGAAVAESTADPKKGRLEYQEETKMLLGVYELWPEQWKKIFDNAKWNQWKWTKPMLIKTGVFTMAESGISINNGSTFADICKDFLRLNIISGKPRHYKVTMHGRQELERVMIAPPHFD